MSTAYIQTSVLPDGHKSDIFCLAGCEKYTVSCSGDGDVTAWDSKAREPTVLGSNKSGAHALAANNHYICAVFFDGTAQVWSTATLEKVDVKLPSAIWSCAINSHNLLALSTIGGAAFVYDLSEGKPTLELPNAGQGGSSMAIDITQDGAFIALAMDQKKVNIYNTETSNLAYTLALHTMVPRAVKFSPLGSLIAVAGTLDSISLYSLNGGDLICTLNGHTSMIFSLSWNETGEYLLSVSHDKMAKIWSTESQSCVTTLNDAEGPLFAGVFLSKGWAQFALGENHQGVATAGVENTIRWYREAIGNK